METTEEVVLSDAANRVFNVPELLEHILLEVAALPIRSKRKRSYGFPERCQLFALRNVSLIFNSTINGSIKLRNQMYRARHISGIEKSKQEGRALRASSVERAYGTKIEKLAYTACVLGKRHGQSWEQVKFLSDDSLEANVICGWGRILTVKPGSTFGQVIDMVLAAGEEDMMKRPDHPGTRYPFEQRWLKTESTRKHPVQPPRKSRKR